MCMLELRNDRVTALLAAEHARHIRDRSRNQGQGGARPRLKKVPIMNSVPAGLTILSASHYVVIVVVVWAIMQAGHSDFRPKIYCSHFPFVMWAPHTCSGGSTGGAEGAPAPPNSMKSMGAPQAPPTISSHS